MKQLEKALNNLITISERLDSSLVFADYVWENNNKVYNTQLSQIAFQFNNGLIPINKTRREKILNKWNTFIYSKNKEINFSVKDVEVLSFESEVLLHEEFWGILIETKNITSKIIIGLLYSSYKNWNTIGLQDSILSIIQNLIYNYSGDNKIIQLWKNNLKYILSSETPRLIARDCAYFNISIHDISKKYSLSLSNTEIEVIIIEKILQEKLLKYEKEKNISIEDAKKIINEITTVKLYKEKSNIYYSLLIKVIDAARTDKNLLKDILKEHLLFNIDYKDPRKNPEKWLNFDEDAKLIFIAWLNEEDIKIFFDIFIDYDPHGRKNFWLNYAKHVSNTQIIQAPNLYQNIKHKQQIVELEAKGQSFPSLMDGQTNAFILYFKDFIVVEFSESGNACYIYKKQDFKQFNPNKQRFYIGELKNKSNAISVVTHHTKWQHNLRNWLTQRGIR